MSNIKVHPSNRLYGEVNAPPSKSHTHRALVVGLLSDSEVEIKNPLLSGDVKATIEACKLFGATVIINGETLRLKPPKQLRAPLKPINAKNSGTTIRFMASVAALASGKTTLTGSESLKKRPMGDLINALQKLHVKCDYVDKKGYPPFTVEGTNNFGGEAEISGAVSSQFISSLLLTLPKSSLNSKIKVVPPIKSVPYLKMTLNFLKLNNVDYRLTYAENSKKPLCVFGRFTKAITFHIPGRQNYARKTYEVPGDFSSVAFILGAAAITGGNIIIRNVDVNSIHADKKIIEDLKHMGAIIKVDKKNKKIEITGNKLNGTRIYCGNSPDLIPVLSSVAAYAKGKTVLYGAEHVRFKETNRLSVIVKEFRKLGVKIKETKTGITIIGGTDYSSEEVLDSHGDHRIFMALTLLGLKAKKPIIIEGNKTYKDSYPTFIEDMKKLGAIIEEDSFE